MPDISALGLKKRVNKEGKLELVDKDPSGKEYIALTCAGKEVTPEDEKFLRVSDTQHSTPRQFVDFFQERSLNAQRDRQNDAFSLEMEDAALRVRREGDDAFGCTSAGYGPGDRNGHHTYRKRLFVFDKNGKIKKVSEETITVKGGP